MLSFLVKFYLSQYFFERCSLIPQSSLVFAETISHASKSPCIGLFYIRAPKHVFSTERMLQLTQEFVIPVYHVGVRRIKNVTIFSLIEKLIKTWWDHSNLPNDISYAMSIFLLGA